MKLRKHIRRLEKLAGRWNEETDKLVIDGHLRSHDMKLNIAKSAMNDCLQNLEREDLIK